MSLFILAQCFGVLALVSWIFSVLQTKRFKILKFQNFANMFYATQYILLGAYPAACMNLISMLRGIMFNSFDKKKQEISFKILILFLLVIIAIGFATFQNIYSLIPIIITSLYSYSVWQKNLTVFRIIFVIAASGWFIYNFLVGAYVSLIGNGLELIFGISAIIKHDFMKK